MLVKFTSDDGSHLSENNLDTSLSGSKNYCSKVFITMDRQKHSQIYACAHSINAGHEDNENKI